MPAVGRHAASPDPSPRRMEEQMAALSRRVADLEAERALGASTFEEAVRRLSGELADLRARLDAPDGAAIAKVLDLDIIAGRMAEAAVR